MADPPTGPRVFRVVHGEERATGEKPLTSYFEGLVHLIKSYVGTGIYAFGAAMMYSGTILGPIFTFVIAYVTLHCQHLLVRSSIKIAAKEPNGENIFPTFEEVVRYGFSDSSYDCLKKNAKLLGTVTDTFLCLGQGGFCVAYAIFIAKHFIEITAEQGWNPPYRLMLFIIMIPLWLSTFLGSLRLLTAINLFANCLIWVGICIIIYYTTSDQQNLADLPVANFQQLPLFFGIVIFSFQNIGLVLPLRSELKNTKSYGNPLGLLSVGMWIVVVIYVIIGILAYWKYGSSIAGSVFLNMPDEELLTKIVRGIVSLSVLFSFTLQFYILIEIIYPVFYTKFGPFKAPYLILCLFRGVMIFVIYAVANISTKLGIMISLVGAIAGSYTCIILPALIDIAVGEISKGVLIKDILLIIFGIIGAVTGTVLSIIDIVEEYMPKENEAST